jgi:uncharacterized RDD family membrane protein YckC
MNEQKVNLLSRRFVSIMIDIPILTLIMIFLSALFTIMINHYGFGERYVIIQAVAVMFFVVFLKDCFKGQSFGKRLLKLRVVNTTDEEPASLGRLIFRNLTLIIWPVDVIMLFVNPEQRLGDMIASTKVVSSIAKRDTV